jgi:hypothetical protein
MHFQTILLTFSAVVIAVVHSAPVPVAMVNTPLFTGLERRGADTDLAKLESDLENADIAYEKARKVMVIAANTDGFRAAEAEVSRTQKLSDSLRRALENHKAFSTAYNELVVPPKASWSAISKNVIKGVKSALKNGKNKGQ